METKFIEIRYSELAKVDCCLSCGDTISHLKLNGNETVVDLGCGKGKDVLKLADLVEDGFVYGVDISDGMLEVARKNAEKFDVKNVNFIKSELENIALDDNIAEYIISNCTINHAKDKNKVWSEIYRILKPGGKFVISDIYSLEPVPEKYSNDPQAVAECWAGAVTKDVYIEQLKRANFKNIEILSETQPYKKYEIMVCSWTIRGTK
jgi:ubiquinone/menaquinone biosynthesis C-methylase UbiE